MRDSVPITNPDYGWGFIIFQMLLWLAVDTCWQTTAMRTFSTKDPETSRKVFSWTGFIFLGRGMMPMLWGIGALAILGPGADSLEAMPIMISKILPVGVLGLVTAGHAGRHDVGQQFVSAGMEFGDRAGYRRSRRGKSRFRRKDRSF